MIVAYYHAARHVCHVELAAEIGREDIDTLEMIGFSDVLSTFDFGGYACVVGSKGISYEPRGGR